MINKLSNNPRLGTGQLQKLTGKKFNEILNYQKPIVLQDKAAINWNLRKGYNAKIVLGGNRTLVLEQLTPGDYGTIEIVQDSVGSRTLILPTGSKVSNGGAGTFTLTTTANAIDIATFYYNGINIYWNLSTNFT
jgi:hypothetical protein